MLEMAYRFRIYPTKSQEQQIQKTFGSVRFIYNYFLALHKKTWNDEKKPISFYDSCKILTSLKNEYDWLYEIDNTALQSSLKDLDVAYKNFFKTIKTTKEFGYPKFKSKKDNNKLYRSKNNTNTIRIEDGKIKIPKVGLIKCKISRNVEGRILYATINQRPSGKYFVSICCTGIEHQLFPNTSKNVGIDLGIKCLATTSEGYKYENHKYLYSSKDRLAKLQRDLSRKSRGSKRYEKARIKCAKLHERISNQRKDTIHKITTDIVRKYDVICVEDLNIRGMQRDKRLAMAINDASFGEFLVQLKYKSQWYGKRLISVDRFFPSSQLCSFCGAKWTALKDLSHRAWICPSCMVSHDRDINASKNILREGLKSIL